MARPKGTLPISANFEPQVAGPFDARNKVDLYSDLLLAATWQATDGQVYTYKGMLVVVANDTAEKNGAYLLIDPNYTLGTSWQKQNGTHFVSAPITTTAALDAHLTPSVTTVALDSPYLDWNTLYFSLLTMPYSHGVYHYMQVAYVFATVTDDGFSIKARWKSTQSGDWTTWKTLAGGGGTGGAETDPIYTDAAPNIQARLRSEVLIQWLVNAQFPQGPIGAQPGDYWIRHIYDTLKRKNGYTNEFENVDWYNDTIYRIGNNRYLHNGSYLVLISEVYQYVPPVPSETITLAANGTYTITSATPANILIRATGAGASITYGTLAANKAVTIAIAPDSQPITLSGNNYEGGITLFVVYTNLTSTWTVNTIVDPKVDDVSDITFRAVLPTTIDVVVESGDIFVAYVVDPTAHGSSNVNPALQQGDIILYRGMDNAAANTTAYSVVTNNGDHIFLRLIATATQLRILRIQGDGVYHNQWDGVNASSIAFIKMGIAPNSISNSQLSQVPTQTIKGRTTAGTGNVEDLTPAQALAVIGARPITYNGEFKTVIATMGSGVQSYIIPKSTITEFNAPMPTNSSMSFRINAGNTVNPSEVLAGEMWQSIVYIRTGADIAGVSFSQPNGTVIFGTLIMQSSTLYKFTWDAIRLSPTAIRVYLTINKV